MIGIMFWAAAAAAPAPAAGMEQLGWLSGHWRTRAEAGADGSAWTEEIWSSREGGTMLGLSRTHKGGRIRAWEFMRIARNEDGSAGFYASPNGGPPVSFRLVRASRSEAVFENPAHDFPQRISYRREGAELVATVSLIDGSKAAKWRFRRYSQGRLGRNVGPLGQHGEAAVVDFGEAALDRDPLGLAAAGAVDGKLAVADRRHEGRVPLQHAELALGAGDDDHVDLLGADEAFGSDEFEVKGHRLDPCYLTGAKDFIVPAR
jgi:hypothetical protein